MKTLSLLLATLLLCGCATVRAPAVAPQDRATPETSAAPSSNWGWWALAGAGVAALVIIAADDGESEATVPAQTTESSCSTGGLCVGAPLPLPLP